MAGGVVGDQVHGHLGAHQFPGCQPRALQARARLVHPDVDLLALFLAGEDHAQRRAEIDRGQGAGVAVVEQVGPVGDHFGPVKAHAPVDLHIFVGQRLGLGQQQAAQIADIRHLRILNCFQHARRGPAQVDGGGAGGVQRSFGRGQVCQQAGAIGGPALFGGQHHAIGPRGPDGRCAAHGHIADAKRHLIHRAKLSDHKLRRAAGAGRSS